MKQKASKQERIAEHPKQKETVSLESIIREKYENDKGLKPDSTKQYDNDYLMYYNARRKTFKNRINRLLTTGDNSDAIECLKRNGNKYEIPIESKQFVQILMEEKKENDKKETEVEYMEYLLSVAGKDLMRECENHDKRWRDNARRWLHKEISMLFVYCDKNKKMEIMKMFYINNIPYYKETMEELKRFVLFFKYVQMKGLIDELFLMTLYGDLQRCTEDLVYGMNRIKHTRIFSNELYNAFMLLENMSERIPGITELEDALGEME